MLYLRLYTKNTYITIENLNKKTKVLDFLCTVCLWQSLCMCVHMCTCIRVEECVPCECSYACVPLWVQRPWWACTESCAQQLAATASDRHSAPLISWPVTIDTHSCAVHREQSEHRQKLLLGAEEREASGENTDTDEHIPDFCHCLQDKAQQLMLFCPRGMHTLLCDYSPITFPLGFVSTQTLTTFSSFAIYLVASLTFANKFT